MSSKLSRRRKNSGKTVQKSETILELDILPAKSLKSFSSPNEPIKEEIPQGNVINYTERSKYWSDKITDLLSDKSRGDIGKLLQENCKRIDIFSQLSELGWKYVSHLDPELKFCSLKLNDEKDTDESQEYSCTAGNEGLYLKLSFPDTNSNQTIIRIDTDFGMQWDQTLRIRDIHQAYVEKVQQYIPIREFFQDLESRARVIEAPQAEQALWQVDRIVAIAPGVCLEIKFDPNDPFGTPCFLLLGANDKIKHLKLSLSENIDKYDAECSLADNIQSILNIDLPFPITEEQINESSNNLNLDCGICYVFKLENSIPTENCNQCNQNFHLECLYECLKNNATSKSHNMLYGKCPFCDTDISCSFKKLIQ